MAAASSAHHALFPGTFDPVTFGHLDVVERAARLFERVTIACATHHEKHHLFSTEQRFELLQTVTAQWDNVEVAALRGLLVDGCVELGADIIVRGLRSPKDFEYELPMTITNRTLRPEIETVFLVPSQDLMHVSSTLVRQIARMGGDVSSFVPSAVVDALRERG